MWLSTHIFVKKIRGEEFVLSVDGGPKEYSSHEFTIWTVFVSSHLFQH